MGFLIHEWKMILFKVITEYSIDLSSGYSLPSFLQMTAKQQDFPTASGMI